MLRIGIKYCGGCNAGYDRVKICRAVREACPDAQWEYVKDGTIYDYILLLQGCPQRCAKTVTPRFETIEICGPEDGEAAVKRITAAIESDSKENLEEK